MYENMKINFMKYIKPLGGVKSRYKAKPNRLKTMEERLME